MLALRAGIDRPSFAKLGFQICQLFKGAAHVVGRRGPRDDQRVERLGPVAPARFLGRRDGVARAIALEVACVQAHIELRDMKANKVLWESASVSFRQEYDATSGKSAIDPAAFFQQDTNALERMSGEFARTIVSSILEAF